MPAAVPEYVSTRLLSAPRAQVFRAFSDPEILAQWWGPNGFRNTFEEFEFRPGGPWRFVMHGPDGTDYPNECEFVEITAPERIVFDHLRPMHWFRMTITLAERDTQTELTWRMRFDTVEEYERVKPYVPAANEQNLDRLEAVLAKN